MEIVAATKFISEKFRSRNSEKGTSGSASCLRAWTHRNRPSSTTPTPRISGMEMNETTLPQL